MNVIRKKTVIAVVITGTAIALNACSSKTISEISSTEAITTLSQTNESMIITSGAELLFSENSTNKIKTTHAATIPNGPIQASNSLDAQFGILSQSFSAYLIEEEDGSKIFDVSHMHLKATLTSEESTNEVMRALIPSFNPADYNVSRNSNGGIEGSFITQYRLRIGEYESFKGYLVTYENNQATRISESLSSFSISSVEASDLPAVTDEVIQAAYQQGRDEVQARNPNYVVQEQSGRPYYYMETGECVYYVKTVYTTSVTSEAKGVVETKYKIS